MYVRKNKNAGHKQNGWYKNRLVLAVAALLVLGGVVTALELTDTTGFFHKRPNPGLATVPTSPTRTSGPNTKGETPGNANKDDKAGSTVDPNTPLKEPGGTFVSNHHPSLGGSPSPNQIQSVCVTTPGATCTVVFTKDGVTKQLPDQLTDGEGAAYWTWKLQDIGLTAGTWKTQAKATLGSQVKTANDAMNLEVGS
jgi:hypothetical protein